MKPHYCTVNLQTYLDYKAYQRMLVIGNVENAYLRDGDDLSTRNVCVKVLPQIADQLTDVCKALNIQKSMFLRLAIDEALTEAYARIDAITKDREDWLEEVDQELSK